MCVSIFVCMYSSYMYAYMQVCKYINYAVRPTGERRGHDIFGETGCPLWDLCVCVCAFDIEGTISKSGHKNNRVCDASCHSMRGCGFAILTVHKHTCTEAMVGNFSFLLVPPSPMRAVKLFIFRPSWSTHQLQIRKQTGIRQRFGTASSAMHTAAPWIHTWDDTAHPPTNKIQQSLIVPYFIGCYEQNFSENTPILSHPTWKTHRRMNEISRKFRNLQVVWRKVWEGGRTSDRIIKCRWWENAARCVCVCYLFASTHERAPHARTPFSEPILAFSRPIPVRRNAPCCASGHSTLPTPRCTIELSFPCTRTSLYGHT